ncbi:MAG: DNA-binding response regulator [Bacillaceae bacterium]|nr:DNA-binding response regulator [Bacillaceae bacterium]
MGFEPAYHAFLKYHLNARNGERQRRLEEGHGAAEKLFLKKVWWPLFHHFDYLHPEYEVGDFKGGKRYLDFAYLRFGIRICIEIDGYGPHMGNVSRWKFADDLERQNQLVIDRWSVIRFSYDDVRERPGRCQQTIRQVVASVLGDGEGDETLSPTEKEILRFAVRKGEAMTPVEVGAYLHLSNRTVRKWMGGLVEKRMLIPAAGVKRVRSYKLTERGDLFFKMI